MNRKIRNSLFKFHTWLGLHLSLFFTFMFLTGSLLVVGFELESIARPAIWTTAPQEERTASFGMIYDGVKEAHPESDVVTVLKHQAPWFAHRAFSRTGWGESISVWTDPATGAVVAETRALGFRSILRDLHDTFLTQQKVVFMLVCATSVLLLFQIVSGLITYRRFWKGFFRWPSRSGGFRAWAGSTHRLTALWSAPMLILVAVSSFYFLLGTLGFEGSAPKPQPPTPRDTALPANFNSALIDQAEERARAALPGFEPINMFLPGRKTDGLVFAGYVEGSSKLFGTTSVSIDPVTLDVLSTSAPGEAGVFAYWRPLMNMLHFGTWGGAFSMALWVILGLIATGLAYTGALIFAARLAPQAAHHGPFRRIWRGLGWTRWAYLLLLAGILGTAFVRYGPDSYEKTRAFPVDAPGSVARLIMQEPLRRDTPLDIELRIGEPDVSAAVVEINKGEAQPVDLAPSGKRISGHFRMTPSEVKNNIVARLQKPDGTEKTVTFRLGQPLW